MMYIYVCVCVCVCVWPQYQSDPVSIAVADSVLSVIEEEKLQENAQVVGEYLKERISLLKNDYSVIGEVR